MVNNIEILIILYFLSIALCVLSTVGMSLSTDYFLEEKYGEKYRNYIILDRDTNCDKFSFSSLLVLVPIVNLVIGIVTLIFRDKYQRYIEYEFLYYETAYKKL